MKTKRKLYLAIALFLTASLCGQAGADLNAIGPIDPNPPVTGTGFPIWAEDANSLQLQPCSVIDVVEEAPGLFGNNPPCLGTELVDPGVNTNFVFDNIAEFSYYRAEAAPGAAVGNFRLRLQVQAANLDGAPVIGNEALIRWRSLPVRGVYTFVTPLGTFQLDTEGPECGDGTNFPACIDQAFLDGLGAAPGFAATITGGVQHFMTNGTGNTGAVLNPGNTAPTDIFLGDFVTPAPLIRGNQPLPPGAELVFRVTGPPGSDLGGPGNPTAESNLFLVEGFVSNCDTNVPPIANNDIFGVLAGSSGAGNILTNDINPGPAPDPAILRSTIRTVGAPAQGSATGNPDGTVTYTHTGAMGIDSFTYTVNDACMVNTDPLIDPGQSLSNEATVQVVSEAIGMKAVLRPKFMQWELSGTSSELSGFAQPTGTAGQTMMHAALLGAQEVPAVMTSGDGSITMTLDETAQTIDYSLEFNGTFTSAIQQAHIHTGAVGTNGPVNFFLCADPALTPPVGTPACPTGEGAVTGSLDAADFIAAGGLATFADAAAGILAGNAYVNVHTVTNPGGEVRGQLGANVMSLYASADGTGPVIGTAMVQADGSWSYKGRSTADPGSSKMVSCVSSNGVLLPNQELQIR